MAALTLVLLTAGLAPAGGALPGAAAGASAGDASTTAGPLPAGDLAPGRRILQTPSGIGYVLGAPPAGGAGGSPPVPDPPASASCPAPGVDDRCEAWTASYDGSNGGSDYGGDAGKFATRTIATSPDGQRVFTMGISQGRPGEGRWVAAVTATDADDGATAWTARVAGTADDEVFPYALAVHPSGEAVYLLSRVFASDGSGCLALEIVALDPIDGSRLSIFEDPDCPAVRSMAVSGDGGTIFYGGSTTVPVDGGQQRGMLVAAVAIDEPGQLGSTIWEANVTMGDHGLVGNVIEVAPDGSAVYVTGGLNGEDGLRDDLTTVAFEAGDETRLGEVLWVAHASLTQPDGWYGNNGGLDVEVTPDGSTVIVSGVDPVLEELPFWGHATSRAIVVAYDAATGQRLWEDRHLGPTGEGFNSALFENMAISPDGDRVFVVTKHRTPGTFHALEGTATLAYDTTTGEQVWADHAWDPRRQIVLLGYLPKIAASPGGVHVTSAEGSHAEHGAHIRTIGYDDGTGERRWTARHWARGLAYPVGVTASPDGSRVHVAGNSREHGTAWFVGVPGDHWDMLTVGYEAGG